MEAVMIKPEEFLKRIDTLIEYLSQDSIPRVLTGGYDGVLSTICGCQKIHGCIIRCQDCPCADYDSHPICGLAKIHIDLFNNTESRYNGNYDTKFLFKVIMIREEFIRRYIDAETCSGHTR